MPEAEPTQVYMRHSPSGLNSRYLLKHCSLLSMLLGDSLPGEPPLSAHKKLPLSSV